MKRIVKFIWNMKFLCACLCILLLYSCFRNFMQFLHIAWAYEQIEIFHEMENREGASDSSDLEGCLDYVRNYYPSGTKQIPGSRLDKIVETERDRVVDVIEARLEASIQEDGE